MPTKMRTFLQCLLTLMAKISSQMKAPQTKRKHKVKTQIDLMPTKNRLGLSGLTARETEVLTWITQGKTNQEIGVILRASTGTICKHVEHILCKLDVKNRTAAAAIAATALANGAGRVSLRLSLFLSWIFSAFGGLTVLGLAT